MTALANAILTLPLDTGNTGKQEQMISDTVSSQLVYAPVVVTRRATRVLGVYRLCMTQQSLLATAHVPASTAFLYFANPVANTGKNLRVRRLWGHAFPTTTLVATTAPRIVAARGTFTGAFSGAALTPDKATDYPASSVYASAVVTGATVTAGAVIGGITAPLTFTAAGLNTPSDADLFNAAGVEDEFEILKAGECMIVYQDVNGTASETRKAQLNMIWDEIDLT